jgi:Acyl-CoA thioesterase C-terminal domain/Acyl-CoA thioesterase N-terminal domain
VTSDLSELDRALRLLPRPEEPGAYDAALDAGWQIGGGVNGGLLLSLVGTALRETLADGPHVDPVSVSAYYLAASVPGPATIRTDVVRAGRSMTSLQCSLVQPDGDGREVERLRALATYGDLAALPDDVRTTASPPDLPPVEECFSTADAPPTDVMAQTGFLDRIDLRMDPSCVGWAVGKPSGRGLLQGWLRMADGREPDSLSLLLAADAFPPVAFDLGMVGWSPTLELTVHVRARPAPGWLRVRVTTVNVAGGMLKEDCEVWDSADRLVAQSRQLARLPR